MSLAKAVIDWIEKMAIDFFNPKPVKSEIFFCNLEFLTEV